MGGFKFFNKIFVFYITSIFIIKCSYYYKLIIITKNLMKFKTALFFKHPGDFFDLFRDEFV